MKKRIILLAAQYRIFHCMRELYRLLRFKRKWENAAQKSVLDNLSHKLIDRHVKISLPEKKIALWLDIRSDLLLRLVNGSYEEEIFDCISGYDLTNSDFIDVGANIGLFSIVISKIISQNSLKKVIAVEPVKSAFRLLEKNIAENNCKNIIPINSAFSDREMVGVINVIEGNEEYSSIGNFVHPATEGKKYIPQEIKITTLDIVVENYKLTPGLIKIDVEGHEFSVLCGALNTLKRFRPIVVFEISGHMLKSNNSSIDAVMRYLKDNNYKVFNIIDAKQQVNKFYKYFEGNAIAIPIGSNES